MKLDITKRGEGLEELIRKTSNPLHSAILRNYRRHAILEVCGMWEEILVPEMTDSHAQYRIHDYGKVVQADGVQQVAEIYKRMVNLRSTVMHYSPEYVTVSDVGMMSQHVNRRFWPGSSLLQIGVEVDEPDAHYLVTQSMCMFFSYNEKAILTGEFVYNGADKKITKCDPVEFITLEECREKLLPLINSIEEISIN